MEMQWRTVAVDTAMDELRVIGNSRNAKNGAIVRLAAAIGQRNIWMARIHQNDDCPATTGRSHAVHTPERVTWAPVSAVMPHGPVRPPRSSPPLAGRVPACRRPDRQPVRH